MNGGILVGRSYQFFLLVSGGIASILERGIYTCILKDNVDAFWINCRSNTQRHVAGVVTHYRRCWARVLVGICDGIKSYKHDIQYAVCFDTNREVFAGSYSWWPACAITSSALTRLSCLRAHKHAYALGSSPPQLHDRLTKILLQALKHR